MVAGAARPDALEVETAEEAMAAKEEKQRQPPAETGGAWKCSSGGRGAPAACLCGREGGAASV
eukprot:4488322-Prorocentrum_lima.AAC.1